MNKKSKNFCIPMKKGLITGLIISLIYAIIISYATAYACLNLELDISKAKTFDLTIWLIPIFFIIFGICILTFITCISGKNEKK